MRTQVSTEHIQDLHAPTRTLSVAVAAHEPAVLVRLWDQDTIRRTFHLDRHRLTVLQCLLAQAQQALVEGEREG